MENELLEKLLKTAEDLGNGEIPELQYNEYYTSGAFDILLSGTRGAEAFQILKKLCERYEHIKNDSSFLRGYLILLDSIVPLTETTELPEGMRTILIENANAASDLIKWYRF